MVNEKGGRALWGSACARRGGGGGYAGPSHELKHGGVPSSKLHASWTVCLPPACNVDLEHHHVGLMTGSSISPPLPHGTMVRCSWKKVGVLGRTAPFGVAVLFGVSSVWSMLFSGGVGCMCSSACGPMARQAVEHFLQTRGPTGVVPAFVHQAAKPLPVSALSVTLPCCLLLLILLPVTPAFLLLLQCCQRTCCGCRKAVKCQRRQAAGQ
mgnify:CR=1 FL=1